MTSNDHNPTASIESWETREAQIRQERAEEFSKLTPEEQQKILDQEKLEFERSKDRLRSDLGYAPFQHRGENTYQERPNPSTNKNEKHEKTPETSLPEFLTLFDAADENINHHKLFEFESAALDDFARPVRQKAYMIQLFDHSQKEDLKAEQIKERLINGKSKPEQISLTFMVDMGEDENNHLGLTNLSMRLSLASLLEGHLTDKLARFTNLVFYAAVMHDRQKNAAPATPGSDGGGTAKRDESETFELRKHNFLAIGEGGGINGADHAFEQGRTAPVAFSLNNGAVWGTFENHGEPVNPQELQESIDKISIEK